MSAETSNNRSVFEYNMSFYYKSTIIYFIVFVLYLFIRGEFVEDSFTLIVSDPVLYFLGLIVIFSISPRKKSIGNRKSKENLCNRFFG